MTDEHGAADDQEGRGPESAKHMGQWIGVFLALGAGVGMLLGFAVFPDSPALGMVFGTSIGLVIGTAVGARGAEEQHEPPEQPIDEGDGPSARVHRTVLCGSPNVADSLPHTSAESG